MEEKVNNESGTRMRLYRMFMTCCVADSRAIPIILEFGSEPPHAAGKRLGKSGRDNDVSRGGRDAAGGAGGGAGDGCRGAT